MRIRVHYLIMTFFLAVTACSSTSDGKNDDSDDDDSSEGSKGSKGSTKQCDDDVTDCAIGSLSERQYKDACDILLTAIDSPTGTKFECEEGPNAGLYLTVNSVAECVATRPPSTCSVTVGELLDCYKTAKRDACEAFGDACTVLSDPKSGCAPKS